MKYDNKAYITIAPTTGRIYNINAHKRTFDVSMPIITVSPGTAFTGL